MRIINYTMYLDSDRKNVLVKENSKNCPEISHLDNPQIIVDMMNKEYHASVLTEEYMWMIAMDSKCKPIGIFEILHGLVNATLLSPREIFTRLCLCGAVKFILVHNHPSGDSFPSKEDIQTTERVKQCGELMNIHLIDHIIIGDGYYSFAENEN